MFLVCFKEHAYSLALEDLLAIRPTKKSSNYSCFIFLELTRILKSYLSITTHALDVGAINSLFMGFEEREEINGILRTCFWCTFNMLVIFVQASLAFDIPLGILR